LLFYETYSKINGTEKKRFQVCKIARKKSDLTCAKLHGKKAISRVPFPFFSNAFAPIITNAIYKYDTKIPMQFFNFYRPFFCTFEIAFFL